MHVGGPGQPTAAGRAIHWHADPSLRVEYIYTDEDRQTIPFVRAIRADGQVKEYVVEGTTPEALAAGKTRTMDCIDCHNVVAHRISPTSTQAVDRAIAAGRVNRSLPFIRREAVRLLDGQYADQDAGAAAVEAGLRSFYAGTKPGVDPQGLEHTIRSLQGLYKSQRLSDDEGDVGRLQGQLRAHDVQWLLPLPRRHPRRERRHHDQRRLLLLSRAEVGEESTTVDCRLKIEDLGFSIADC